MKILWLVLGVLLIWASSSEAACSGSSPTRTAANATLAEVQACVTTASNGDTIRVPAGSATWSGTIAITKELIILGANVIANGGAAGGTNITSGGTCFALSHAHNIRISGFNFINCTIDGTGLPGPGKAFRVDHNSFHASGWTINNSHGDCQTPMRHPTTLWDHNSFFNYSIHTQGTNCNRSEGDYQDQLWAQPPPFGNGTGVVYVEDNIFDGNNTINWMDGNYGARYVARFNTITNSGGYMEIHSVQGDNRSNQMWEIYHNKMTGPGGYFGLAYIRSASGFVFGNRVPSGTQSIKLNNVRSSENRAPAGLCGGTSSWDKNTPGQSGWPCRDQIGRSRDNSKWTTGAVYAQESTPAYFWDNIAGASTQQYVPEIHGDPMGNNLIHIVQNRDWYTQNTSFNGITGVGVGPIASRPSTCTTGVAYWATDQGEWNNNQAGADGQLYKCTATNTWTLYYIPYPYPHPLQTGGGGGGGDVTPPNPPANVRIQ